MKYKLKFHYNILISRLFNIFQINNYDNKSNVYKLSFICLN